MPFLLNCCLWDLANGKSHPHSQHRKVKNRSYQRRDQRRAEKTTPRASSRMAGQESGATLTLLLPGMVQHPLHRHYPGGGTNMENMVQMLHGCREKFGWGGVGGLHWLQNAEVQPTACSTSQRESPPSNTPFLSLLKISWGYSHGKLPPPPSLKLIAKPRKKGMGEENGVLALA